MQESKKEQASETMAIQSQVRLINLNYQTGLNLDAVTPAQNPDVNVNHIYVFNNDFKSPNSLNDKIRELENSCYSLILTGFIDDLTNIVEVCHREYQKTLAGTAYHEAGHAVAAYTLRRDLESVSIIPDENSLGRTKLYSGDDINYAVIDLAGFIAKYKAFGIAEGHEQDFRCIDELVSSLTKSLSEEVLLRTNIADYALSLFESLGFWDAVGALAKALLEHKELDGNTAKRIIKNAKQRARRKNRAAEIH